MGDPVARPIPLPTSSGNFGPDPGAGATGGFVDVAGVVAIETSGFPVTVVVRERSVTGTVIAAAVCTANGTFNTTFTHAVRSNGRLFAQITGTGVLAGSVDVL